MTAINNAVHGACGRALVHDATLLGPLTAGGLRHFRLPTRSLGPGHRPPRPGTARWRRWTSTSAWTAPAPTTPPRPWTSEAALTGCKKAPHRIAVEPLERRGWGSWCGETEPARRFGTSGSSLSPVGAVSTLSANEFAATLMGGPEPSSSPLPWSPRPSPLAVLIVVAGGWPFVVPGLVLAMLVAVAPPAGVGWCCRRTYVPSHCYTVVRLFPVKGGHNAMAGKKGSSGGGKARSAITGRYVKGTTAKRHPKTTVVERPGKRKKGK